MAAPRFLAYIAGRFKQVATIATSAGAGDADKIPATGAAGTLDPSLLNAATTGASKVVMTDGTGHIDSSILPTGIGADTASIVTSEAVSAGDFVNIWDSSGTPKVRKADATAEGKEAHGFVLAAASLGASATVYFEGRNTQVTSRTNGAMQYLSATTPGAVTETAPSTAGNVVQALGIAVSATSVDFERGAPVTVA